MDCSPPGSSVHGISQARITGVGCHALLQGLFLTQGSNPLLLCLLHSRQILYRWATWEAPDVASKGAVETHSWCHKDKLQESWQEQIPPCISLVEKQASQSSQGPHPWGSPGVQSLATMGVRLASQSREYVPVTGPSWAGAVCCHIPHGLLGGSVVKKPPVNAGDLGLISRLGRSPGEGNGNPLQYSCLGNQWTEEPGGLQFIGSQSWTQLTGQTTTTRGQFGPQRPPRNLIKNRQWTVSLTLVWVGAWAQKPWAQRRGCLLSRTPFALSYPDTKGVVVCLNSTGVTWGIPGRGLAQLGVSWHLPLTGFPQGRLCPFFMLSLKVFRRRIRISFACFSLVWGWRLYLL